MMLLSRGWRLLKYSFFTSISFRIFSLLVRHSLYFSASLRVGILSLPHTTALNLPRFTWMMGPSTPALTEGTRRAQTWGKRRTPNAKGKWR